MSEFQFYGFRSIDRNLTKEERQKISQLSSRTTPTANSATFVYHYGDFPADEESILIKYFDVMLYYANWGTLKLMFRLPREGVNYQEMVQYINLHEADFSNGINVIKNKQYVLVTIELNADEYCTYDYDVEECFNEMPQWRQLLMDGDYSILFLAWLQTQRLVYLDREFDGEDVDELDPDEGNKNKVLRLPYIPSGITSLSSSLKDVVKFFLLPNDWLNGAISLAQKTNNPLPNLQPLDYIQLIEKLPETVKNNYLHKLLKQEVNLHLKLKNELEEISGITKPSKKLSQYTIDDLYNEVQNAIQVAKLRQKQEAEEKARKKLAKLVTDEAYIWKDVIVNIERFDRKGYKSATKDLKNLLKVAKHLNKLEEYTVKLEEIKAKYSTKRSLISMLNEIVY